MKWNKIKYLCRYKNKVAKLMFIINDTEKQSVVVPIFFVFWPQLKRIIWLRMHWQIVDTIFRMKCILTHPSSDRIKSDLTYTETHTHRMKQETNTWKMLSLFFIRIQNIFHCLSKTYLKNIHHLQWRRALNMLFILCLTGIANDVLFI